MRNLTEYYLIIENIGALESDLRNISLMRSVNPDHEMLKCELAKQKELARLIKKRDRGELTDKQLHKIKDAAANFFSGVAYSDIKLSHYEGSTIRVHLNYDFVKMGLTATGRPAKRNGELHVLIA